MAVRHAVSFGDLLRHYRKRAGMTQEQVAERAGLSVRGISDLERGVNRAPYRSTVQRLADALDLVDEDRAALEQISSRYGGDSRTRVIGASPSSSFPPFIGRAAELELVRAHLRGELPPMLAIAGEPGIGKTSLLRVARDVADGLGIPVLQAGCQRAAGEQPYSPLGDALSASVRGLPPIQVRSALKGCGWLSRLLPELADVIPVPHSAGDLSPEAERRLLIGAVTRFLQNTAAPHGVLLILDDLQWAGRDALDLLLALSRSSSETGVRIACAYRATEVAAADPLSTILADAAHAGLVEHVALAPLTFAECSQLIDALVPDGTPPAAREQVLTRSGGVPFFLVSCASALCASESGDSTLPWTVAQSIRQRVAALSDTAQDVLAVAAVCGRVVSTGVVMEVVGEPPAEVASALDEACRAALLTEHGSHEYAFTHDVIQEVVEIDLGSARRMYLHGAVGDALERSAGVPSARHAAVLAWHFGEANEVDRTMRYALLAGDHAASLYAHRDAAMLYTLAASHASSLGDQPVEAEAREKAGRELTLVGDYAAAVALLDSAASLYRSLHDVEAEARVVAQLGWTHFFRATPNDAVARVETLVEQLWDQPRSASLARLCVTLTFLWYADRPWQALEAAERACKIAEGLGDERLLAVAQVRRGLVLGRTGRWDEGERVLAGAAALAEQVDDLESQAHALEFAGIACSLQGKLEEGRDYYLRAVGLAEQLDDPMAIAYGLRSCGTAYFALGEWEKARVYYDRARKIDESSTSTFSGLIPLQTLELVLAQGRWEEVDQLAAECLARFHGQRNDRIDTNLLCLLAERDLLQGRLDTAFALLEARLDDFYADEKVNLGVRTTPIEVCLATGDLLRAEALLSQYTDLISEQGNHRLKPAALRARGLVRAAQGQFQPAEEALAEAADLAEGMKHVFGHARILLVWAQVSLTVGSVRRAWTLAGEADRLFRRLGATPYAAQARELREGSRMTASPE